MVSTKGHSGTSTGPHLPDFLIIGAQKCGTTSLYHTLTSHPRILPAVTKEVHFFDVPKRWRRGIGFYSSHFPATGGGTLTGEASPYYLFHPRAANRATRIVPDAKLVVLLRNPVDRAYSDYQHALRRGYEVLSFAEAVEAEHDRVAGEEKKMRRNPAYHSQKHRRYSYLARGVYLPQIRRWHKRFGKQRMLILKSEDFYATPGVVSERVVRFLGLEEGRLWLSERGHNRKTYAPMPPEIREKLAEHFEPHNERLYGYLGVDFGW